MGGHEARRLARCFFPSSSLSAVTGRARRILLALHEALEEAVKPP